ncbi:hypothetical protein [Natronorubrum thiooxidans]|uniref:Uncharacterized protein n=1 Tax=Natronorubrum thiooxidans TaxID=308853 RepID=A0A1N7FA80_9EURY|nr:hypothetical protein [Natronorubrum thiooxidans]SIR97220.1 hypothetical protein SAMN05421752_106124 [Natronorubrum thiooxidans]
MSVVPLEYYDKLLLAIVGSLALGGAIGIATSVAFEAGLAGGAAVATLFVYDAVFRNPPLPTAGVRAAVLVWHVFLVVILSIAIV